ncbi:MAG: hypothetical protein M3Q47_06150 [Actinomycetota bacterium]|nr:hypothetical protein [Actinomycetota bacterium]
MTWTKLGEEWPDSARELTDGAFRTHVEALCWSNRRGLDLTIPKRDLKRFAETDDPDTAVKNLIAAGWWQDCSDSWFIGVQFADWQIEAAVVARRREQSALTTRRSRLHKAGDHSLCLAHNCPYLRAVATGDRSHDPSQHLSPGTERNGTEQNGAARSEDLVVKLGETKVVVAPDWPSVLCTTNGHHGCGWQNRDECHDCRAAPA